MVHEGGVAFRNPSALWYFMLWGLATGHSCEHQRHQHGVETSDDQSFRMIECVVCSCLVREDFERWAEKAMGVHSSIHRSAMRTDS